MGIHGREYDTQSEDDTAIEEQEKALAEMEARIYALEDHLFAVHGHAPFGVCPYSPDSRRNTK